MSSMMTQKDWEEIDYNSRVIVRNFLSTINANAIGESTGNCSWDISCVINDKPISFEIKDRNMPHNKYSDMMVEQIKQDCNNRRIGKGQFKECLVVSVYTDNVMCLANINDKDAVHKTKYCKATTLIKGANQNYVPKEIIILPQRRKIKYEYVDGNLKFSKI